MESALIDIVTAVESVIGESSLRWIASIATVLAASLVAARGSARITAIGFVLFVIASLAWIVSSLMADQHPLLIQNLVLLGINVVGVWRWMSKVVENG